MKQFALKQSKSRAQSTSKFFFAGWKIWKMLNNRKDHIVQVIHAILREYQQWQDNCKSSPRGTKFEAFNARSPYHCLVDALLGKVQKIQEVLDGHSTA